MRQSKGIEPARSRSGRPGATVAMGFVTGMLSGPLAHGMDIAPLLVKARIDHADLSYANRRVPLAAYAMLYNLIVAELQDEGFGLFAEPLRPGCFEFLCRSVLSSGTLEDALSRCARFLGMVLPELHMVITRHRDAAQIEIREQSTIGDARDDPRRVFAFEWMLRLVHGLACWLVDRSLTLDSVSFP